MTAAGEQRAGRGRYSEPVIGRLQGHGAANYQFRADQDRSYYVQLLTDRGVRTLWGKDLERALARAVTQPKIGDVVGAQRLARQAVTVTQRSRDAQGHLVSQTAYLAHRTRWRIEKVKFFVERARLARQVRDAQADARRAVQAHPELKSTFVSLRAAEAFAERRIANPEDRARFIEMVRGVITTSIQRGEPLPDVRLRDNTKRPQSPSPPATPRKPPDEPTR